MKPPPVEPAQAPQIIRKTIIALERAGQRSKSVVENPVVVIILETWNAAWRKASPNPPYILRILKAIVSVETAIIPR